MKACRSLVVLASLAVLVPAAPALANHGKVCSDRTIFGRYGFTVQGFILGDQGGPVAGIAHTFFDGRGGLEQIDWVVRNGQPVLERRAAGTYSVNEDCTGTFTLTFEGPQPPLTTQFVITDNGREIRTVVTNPNTAITSEGRRL